MTESIAYNEEILRLTAILKQKTWANVQARAAFNLARKQKKLATRELRDARRALNNLLLGKVAATQIPLALHANGIASTDLATVSDLTDCRRVEA